MRLSLDELMFFGVYIAFTLYLISIVGGVITKLFFLWWMLSVLGFAVYVLVKREE